MTVKEIIKNEVDNLPNNVLEEVLDFIRFLEDKKEKSSLSKAMQKLSEPSFHKIWDNEEDSIYDRL